MESVSENRPFLPWQNVVALLNECFSSREKLHSRRECFFPRARARSVEEDARAVAEPEDADSGAASILRRCSPSLMASVTCWNFATCGRSLRCFAVSLVDTAPGEKHNPRVCTTFSSPGLADAGDHYRWRVRNASKIGQHSLHASCLSGRMAGRVIATPVKLTDRF